MSRSLLLLSINLIFAMSLAGSSSTLDRARTDLARLAPQLGLADRDVQEVRISSSHRSNSSGFQYVYLQQRYKNLDVFQAIFNLVYDKQQQLVAHNHTFQANLVKRAEGWHQDWYTTQTLTIVARDLGLPLHQVKEVGADASNNIIELEVSSLSEEKITVQKVWMPFQDRLRMVYRVEIHESWGGPVWHYLVDPITTEIVEKRDLVLRCHFGHQKREVCRNHQHTEHFLGPQARRPSPLTSVHTYRVFPLYSESPLHAQHSLVFNPADPEASPFGWHDVDGQAGSEFLDTRGNNVFAQDDTDADDTGGQRPDGGSELSFDFDFRPGAPNQNINAALTNLFYWVNINHDILYQYGFDEAAGNFQVRNYQNQGQQEDPILADAQDATARNNATFFASADGAPARMEMYLWGDSIYNAGLRLQGVSNIPGFYSAVESGFSSNNKLARLGNISGEIVRVIDEGGTSSLACSAAPISNGEALAGKIALIDRGSCVFTNKVRRAEDFGAIAVIICNNVPGEPVVMGGTDNNITIPAIMISNSDCAQIVSALKRGQKITANIERKISEDDLDSSFDNLIVTHEFGHGVSIRLTGGAASAHCLFNFEQMGEGWSDYFGLMLTTDWEKAHPNDVRGIATYLSGESVNGRGIRNFPYTTDRRANPVRYDQVKHFSVPHGTGSIWCSMLWDMTWNIIEQEGRSPDMYRGMGGNNIALQLVIEALKIQPCNPGFVDARDAILTADQMLYGGRHLLSIWKAFAARGLGVDAEQGDPNNLLDGVNSFKLPDDLLTQINRFEVSDSVASITVNWTSLREVDHHSFRLMRSTDGVNYQEIEEFRGGSTKNFSTMYTYDDYNVVPGRWYHYRLDQVSDQGLVREMGLDSALIVPFEKILVFPNPNAGDFELKVSPEFLGELHLSLRTVKGKTVWDLKDQADQYYTPQKITVQELPAGTYLLEIRSSEETWHQRLVIL